MVSHIALLSPLQWAMRDNLSLLCFRSISVVISNIGLIERSAADCRLFLRRIISFTAHPHRLHIVEALCIFVIFGKVVNSAASCEVMGSDVEE